MPFRRGNRKLANIPIVSNKEMVDAAFLIVAGGVTTDIQIAAAVNDYTGTQGTCPTNAQIKGFYMETSYANNDSIVGRTDWFLCKRSSGIAITSFPTPGSTGGHELRRLIFHERKGIITNSSGGTQGGQVSKAVEFIGIPKRFRKMSENDGWFIRVGSSENYSFCLKCIYKWYI